MRLGQLNERADEICVAPEEYDMAISVKTVWNFCEQNTPRLIGLRVRAQVTVERLALDALARTSALIVQSQQQILVMQADAEISSN